MMHGAVGDPEGCLETLFAEQDFKTAGEASGRYQCRSMYT